MTSAIRAFVAAAPAVSSASRRWIEPVVLAAAERHGGAVVRTCHRIEWYHEAGVDTFEVLDLGGEGMPDGALALAGPDAVERIVSLSLGLESVVLGEDQILHQVRLAVADARGRGPFGGELALAFDLALHAGRLGRTWHPARPTSIADLAVRRGEALAGDLGGRRVLVVGSGEMGRLAAGAARAKGARVALASRTPERALEAAARLHVDAWPFDPGAALAEAAVVVVALAGPWTLEPGSVGALATGTVVVDLSMPGALTADVVGSLGTRHIGIDDLATRADGGGEDGSDEDLATRRYRRRLVGLRDRTLETFSERIAERERAGAARALAERLERERVELLEGLYRSRPGLGPADRAAIEAMTVRLAGRVLRPVLEESGRADEDIHAWPVRKAAGL